MRLSLRTCVHSALVLALNASWVASQTYTSCNPLLRGGCPADTALGTTTDISFASGASSQFTTSGSVTYSPDGAAFAVARLGDSPTITSKWYVMFGRVEFVVKAAPGIGIVSCAILQSDCLDEIDWEWLGGDNAQVQTNFFGKGATAGYTRGAIHPASNNHDQFRKYVIEWTAEQIVWSIDGVTVRVFKAANARPGEYPSTPMQVKVGIWAGGDPSNSQGTITWAGGYTDYSKGPYTMYLKSMQIADYSTGSSYSYSGTSGEWTSIRSDGGSINARSSLSTPVSRDVTPSVTAVVINAPPAFHYGYDISSTRDRTGWPWVAQSTASTVPKSNSNSGTPYVPIALGVLEQASTIKVVGSVLFCIAIALGI